MSSISPRANSAVGLFLLAMEMLWQPIGPAPTSSKHPNNWGVTSGRINAIAVSPSDPQLVLIGGATGGIWRSTDGGNSFTPVSDNHVDLAVGSIAFPPSNNQIVYAGMGDTDGGYLGTGVLKSTDGGQNWTRVSNSSLPSPGRISKIEVDSNDPNRVYVAQFSGFVSGQDYSSGFWYSTNGGVSWTRTIAGLPRDLVKHPTQPNTLYLSLQRVDLQAPSTGGVFKSTNSGLTWSRVYNSPFTTTSNIRIAVTPAAPQNLYVLAGEGATWLDVTARVEVSTNEGATWTNRGSAFDAVQMDQMCFIFVHPTDANTIFVGTRDLWRSQNGGATYTNITNNFTISNTYDPYRSKSHPDQHHFYISPSNPNLMYIANDGGLSRSIDGANSFQSLNASLSLTMFTSLAIHPTDASKTYGGTQDNGTQRRSNAQGSWEEFIAGDGGQTVIDPLDPTIVYTTYIYRTMWRWANNGSTLSATIGTDAVFNNDRTAFYPPFIGNKVNSTLYFGTYRLYLSTNRGNTWTAPAGTLDLTRGGSDTLSAIGVGRSNTDIIYTGSAQGRVMVSANRGFSWTDRTAGLPNRFIKSIIVSPTNSNVAYLTVSGFNSGHVFKTVNAGASWTDISGNLPNIPANTLLIDPLTPTTLYVGTDIGVFRSSTDGTNWETFNPGMPPAIVSEIEAQDSGLIQAATYGRGAFEIGLSNTSKTRFDFDGDGKADISVFRPSVGGWYISRSSDGAFSSTLFGQNGDLIAPADFDGDGKTDISVFRDGFWYRLNSSTGVFVGLQFGSAGDKPVPGDFDGDGKADISVFRPSNGTWYRLNSSNGAFTGNQWGTTGDLPQIADFDGDGKSDLAVFRPSTGAWYASLSSNNAFFNVTFGTNGDIPTPADYDRDGKTDVAVFRPSNGTWYLQRSQLGFTGIQFGADGDLPVAADYDGDGKADVAVFRNGAWYLNRTTAGFTGVWFGTSTDQPIPKALVP